MKYLPPIIIFFHGLIHILGFVKGFGIRELKELTLPVSKPMGVLWLTATILILIYGFLYVSNNKYAWLLGFIAAAVSQILIILFWKDARFGTLPNIMILLVSVVSFGYFSFQKLVQTETDYLLSRKIISDERAISEDEIKDLPVPVKKWLHHSGAIGKPFIYAGKIMQKAEMKMKPEQKNWMKATALQYNTIDIPAFIWIADVRMNSILNFKGRDKFVDGKGEMLIKLNSLINVANEQGEKLDEGTIQRYLGEMVWFPSLALSPYISWQQVDETTVVATMDYKGTKGSGTFFFSSDGDFIKYSALRYMGNEADSRRYEWILSVDGNKTFEGITVPSRMTATWKLDSGDWTWLKLEIADLKFNENARP